MDQLVSNWFRNVKSRSADSRPLWACVVDAFAIGRMSAIKLCEDFGHDPDREVPGLVVDGLCGACNVMFCADCEELMIIPEGHVVECEHCKEAALVEEDAVRLVKQLSVHATPEEVARRRKISQTRLMESFVTDLHSGSIK